MKREILFRGKRTDNGQWVYGFFYLGDYQLGSYIIEFKSECIVNEIEVIPESVGQFTRLLDKNGKKIFEGDIVYLSGYGDYVVEFPFIDLYEASCENDIGSIKGNIHDNPDLL